MSSTNDYNEIANKEFPGLIQILERHLDLKHWKFDLTYAGALPDFPPCILYQSEQCKIRFRWEHDRPHEEPIIHAEYGRLHAPLDKHTMMWNGELCRCWHTVESIINFLDEVPLTDIGDKATEMPPLVAEFYYSSKDKVWSQPEFTARKHAHIWKHYGQRIFDLLDIRRSGLWEEYVSFLKDYYTAREERARLNGVNRPPLNPPRYKVC